MARICPTCPAVLSGADAVCPIHRVGADGDDPFVGRTLGAYRIAQRLRAERGGVWYRAVDAASNRFAVLIGYGELAAERSAVDAARQEAARAAQLTEARIARIVATGTSAGGPPYLVYETPPGQNLSDLIEHGGPFDLSRALKTTRAVCEAFVAADAWELPHLGLKPELIALDGEKVIVTGFGASKMRHAVAAPLDVRWLGAPSGKEPSFTDDVYALGTLFHALVFGAPPGDEPRSLPRDPALGRLLARMVAKNRSARPTSVEELMEELVERPRARLASDLSIPPEPGVNTYILKAGSVERERVSVAAAGLDLITERKPRADTAPMPSGTFNDKGAAGVAPLPPDKRRAPQHGAAVDRADTHVLPPRASAPPNDNERRIETMVVRPRGLSPTPSAAITAPNEAATPEPRPTKPMASAAPIVLEDDDIEPLDPPLDSPRKKPAVPLVVGAIAIVAAALGSWLALGGREEPRIEVAAHAQSPELVRTAPAKAADPVEAPDAVEAPPPIDPVKDAPLPDGDALPEGDSPAEPEPTPQVVLRIDSQPQGAMVYLTNGSVVVGQTPFEIRREPSDERMGFELRLAGYKPSIETLSAREDGEIEVVLEKLEARPPPPPPPPRRVRRRAAERVDRATSPPPPPSRRKVSRSKKSLERGTLLDPFAE